MFISISNDIEISVGKLGLLKFTGGEYIYTGSAMKNLIQRVERHKRKEKKIKWHIDYLLANAFVSISEVKIKYSIIKEECKINQESIQFYDAEIPVKKFGSSDCKKCQSHLIKIK